MEKGRHSFTNFIDPELEEKKTKLHKLMNSINTLRKNYEKIDPDWKEEIDEKMLVNIDKFCRYTHTILEDFFISL